MVPATFSIPDPPVPLSFNDFAFSDDEAGAAPPPAKKAKTSGSAARPAARSTRATGGKSILHRPRLRLQVYVAVPEAPYELRAAPKQPTKSVCLPYFWVPGSAFFFFC